MGREPRNVTSGEHHGIHAPRKPVATNSPAPPLPRSPAHPFAVSIMLAVLAAALPCYAEEDIDLLEQQAFQAAADRVSPSVVRIETIGGLERVGRVLFGTGPTTGLIVDPKGYVVSSAFNFLNRPASILVQLPDGTRKPAELVATDHNRMIVLLKIETDEPLPTPETVPQDKIRVGAWAVAVGRAFQSERPNLAVGIISAVNRIWGKAVQTDAAVSPNNYGGPLVDVRGRVLGVLVPLSPQSAEEVAGYQWYDSGIGFAVLAEDVMAVLPRLKKGDDLYPGVIGIGFGRGNLYTSDPVIASVRPNSPAYDAGLKAGDKIDEVDGRKTPRAADVKQVLAQHYAGESVKLVALRDKERIECELELVAELDPYEHPFLGILPMRAAADDADEPAAGVPVRWVYPESSAAEAGITAGDVLVGLAGEEVKTAAELRDAASRHKPDEEVKIQVRRDEETVELAVKLGHQPENVPDGDLPSAREAAEPPETPGTDTGKVSLKIPEFPNDAWVYVPKSYDPAVPHGVLAWLAPPGELDVDAVFGQWQETAQRDGLLLLAVKPSNDQRWLPQEVTLVRKLLDEIAATYTVDPTRVVLGGGGAGGTLAFAVAFRNRDAVAGAAAVEAPVPASAPENEPAHRMAFYVAKTEKSKVADRVDAAVEQLRAKKYPVTVRTLGESPRELEPSERDELARWIDTLDRI